MLKKIAQHVRRMAKARRFGVPYVRRATFALPTAVRLDGRVVPVVSPAEHGAQNDFLTCFIEDEYGLNQVDDPIETVADIGANIGFFSMAARSYFPAATVHAYEPNPRILPYTSKNADAAGFRLFPEAVGATSGFVSIEDTGDSNQARTVPDDAVGIRLPQVSLSTVVERLGGRIDLAKIDCEGAEWELFTHATAWTGIKRVRMEYHLWGKHAFAEVEQNLERLGFTIHCHNPSRDWGIVWARGRAQSGA